MIKKFFEHPCVKALISLIFILIPIAIYMDSWLAIIIYSIIVILTPFILYKFNLSENKYERFFLKSMICFSLFYIWFVGYFIISLNKISEEIRGLSTKSLIIQYIDSFESDYVRYFIVAMLIIIIIVTTISPFLGFLINSKKMLKE